MEQLIIFNGVRILLTTGQTMREIQSFVDQAEVIISVYPGDVKVLKDAGVGVGVSTDTGTGTGTDAGADAGRVYEDPA